MTNISRKFSRFVKGHEIQPDHGVGQRVEDVKVAESNRITKIEEFLDNHNNVMVDELNLQNAEVLDFGATISVEVGRTEVLRQSKPVWIDRVEYLSTGKTRIHYIKGLFRESPAGVSSHNGTGTNYTTFASQNAQFADIETRVSGGANIDVDYNVIIKRID